MSPALEIEDLRVRAESGRVLLDISRLTLAPGTCLGVAGPSGAGKTTFLYAIAGLLAEADGRIRWQGADILALSSPARGAYRAGHMGFVFQDFMLFEELSALENAAIASGYTPRAERAALRDRAAAALERLGLTDTDRRIETFSGGERQRVAIARALAGAPDILLADEPTASLNREAADQVIEDLVAAAREHNRTLVAVSHDTALLARMDRVLTLENGRGVSQDRAA
ncbi:MAG: ABC transporter ATP-binding protein [Pseudomonadota bacterium]